jgi:hypothetical protein
VILATAEHAVHIIGLLLGLGFIGVGFLLALRRDLVGAAVLVFLGIIVLALIYG